MAVAITTTAATAAATGALEPYLTLDGLGTRAKRRDGRVARVRNAARLLASVAGGEEPEPGAPPRPPSRLLSAHACHGAFAPDEAAALAAMAEAHTRAHGWLTKRHGNHPTTDFSLHDAPALWALAEPIVTGRVLPTLRLLFFGDEHAPVDLVINDLFYARYDGDTPGSQVMLEQHRDGSLLSFSVALSDPQRAFQGGGTRFVGSGLVLRPQALGDLVVHSGKVLHAGEPVTGGVRDILVGFVTASGPLVNERFLNSKMVTAACEHQRLDEAIVNGALIETAMS